MEKRDFREQLQWLDKPGEKGLQVAARMRQLPRHVSALARLKYTTAQDVALQDVMRLHLRGKSTEMFLHIHPAIKRKLADICLAEYLADMICPMCKGAQVSYEDKPVVCISCKGSRRYRWPDSEIVKAMGVKFPVKDYRKKYKRFYMDMYQYLGKIDSEISEYAVW